MSHLSNEMARIGIVLPYFGKLPNYFPLFLESCRQNPTVDWLFYTDSIEDMPYPENFHVQKLSFSDFRNRIQKSFDFEICLNTPYKLCDFKATYGDVLQEDLAGYDFWGHCDCDLIFGNIRKFITKDITDNFDRICNCGHLILYRNIPQVNRYYREQAYADYKLILQSPSSYSFDEWPGISGYWQKDGLPCFGELCYDDIANGIDDFRPTQIFPGGYIGPYHGQPDASVRFRKMRNIVYLYEEGKLERCWLQNNMIHREEVMYAHFQKRKMQIDTNIFVSHFLAVPNRFTEPVDLTPESIQLLAPKKTNRTTMIRILKNWIKIILCDLKNIGKEGYCNNSAIINCVKTYFER